MIRDCRSRRHHGREEILSKMNGSKQVFDRPWVSLKRSNPAQTECNIQQDFRPEVECHSQRFKRSQAILCRQIKKWRARTAGNVFIKQSSTFLASCANKGILFGCIRRQAALLQNSMILEFAIEPVPAGFASQAVSIGRKTRQSLVRTRIAPQFALFLDLSAARYSSRNLSNCRE